MTDICCPRCRHTMQRCGSIDGVIAGCPSCGGIFIDNRAGAAVVGGSSSPAANAFIQAHEGGDFSSFGDEGAYRSPDARSAAVCPTCDRPMRVERLEDVEVDICDADGTFFDHRELKAFMFSRAAARAHQHGKAVRRAVETESLADAFHRDVRAPTEDQLRGRGATFWALRDLLHQVKLFVRR